MYLRRYISRRYITLVQYAGAAFLLYLLYTVVFAGGSSRSGVPEPLSRDEIDFPAGGDRVGNEIVKHAEGGKEEIGGDKAKEVQKRAQEAALMKPAPAKPEMPANFKRFVGVPRKSWEPEEMMSKDLAKSGPGEHGAPVKLDENDKIVQKQALELYKANGYNAYISDLISLNRTMKDLRHKECKTLQYLDKLPTVSVIFPFHEEHNSTLLRSAHSVINQSPPELLKEIILVDDFSEKPFLKKPLEDYWKAVGLDHIVKVVRTKKREGLIRARQLGAEAAIGEVLIFLDAHSEANYNWLPPLLEPIANDYRTVVCPFVDVIDCDTYELRAQDEGARGSFDWTFNYKRLPLTKKDREQPTRPFNSPVMAGGYFAISKDWFWELGGYDEGLDIWGGEQYELSFKVWQCHGRMVDAPCSRVAHIYRCKYMPFKNAGMGDFVSRNYKRVAEVWMDEYAEILYKKRPGVRNADAGDLTRMKGVRQKLQCKSFDWFMKEIAFDQDRYYPAVDPPPSASGELRHTASNLCLDTQFKSSGQRFGLRKCVSDDANGGGEQNIRLTRWHDIRPKDRNVCFDVSTSVDKAPVVLFDCHSMKGNQLWKLRDKDNQLFHPVSHMCLAADANGSGELYMKTCDVGDKSQQWHWQVIDSELLNKRQGEEAKEGDL